MTTRTRRRSKLPRDFKTLEAVREALRDVVGPEGSVYVSRSTTMRFEPGHRYESEHWSGRLVVLDGITEVAAAEAFAVNTPAALVAVLSRELQVDLMRRARARQFAHAAVEATAPLPAITATAPAVRRIPHVIELGST